MNAILRYPGAKWSIATWVQSFFPPHHSYLEPFFGSGAVFFTKTRSNIETINDLDGEVVTLFECIRRDPERLAREVHFTPYSREVYEKAYKPTTETDPYIKAARMLIRCNMGYGFRINGNRPGWKNDISGRERAYAAKAWMELPEILVEAAERLRGVQIEHRPAVQVIKKFNSPQVLIYCDPPYVLSTRNGKQYRCEMDDRDHLELLKVCKEHRGPVLISGYASELYDRELMGWHRETTETLDQLSNHKKEVLWMNFSPMGQESLF